MTTNSVAIHLERYFTSRDVEAERIKVKLDKMTKWQKRYDKLTNPTSRKTIQDRVDKLVQIAADNHITFTTPDPYGSLKATYQKEEVTLKLITHLYVSPDGVVSMDFTKESYPGRPITAFRVSVGKTIRIRNNILATLLGAHDNILKR